MVRHFMIELPFLLFLFLTLLKLTLPCSGYAFTLFTFGTSFRILARTPPRPIFVYSVTQKTPRRIGQPGSFGTGQVGGLFPGQVTSMQVSRRSVRRQIARDAAPGAEPQCAGR